MTATFSSFGTTPPSYTSAASNASRSPKHTLYPTTHGRATFSPTAANEKTSFHHTRPLGAWFRRHSSILTDHTKLRAAEPRSSSPYDQSIDNFRDQEAHGKTHPWLQPLSAVYREATTTKARFKNFPSPKQTRRPPGENSTSYDAFNKSIGGRTLQSPYPSLKSEDMTHRLLFRKSDNKPAYRAANLSNFISESFSSTEDSRQVGKSQNDNITNKAVLESSFRSPRTSLKSQSSGAHRILFEKPSYNSIYMGANSTDPSFRGYSSPKALENNRNYKDVSKNADSERKSSGSHINVQSEASAQRSLYDIRDDYSACTSYLSSTCPSSKNPAPPKVPQNGGKKRVSRVNRSQNGKDNGKHSQIKTAASNTSRGSDKSTATCQKSNAKTRTPNPFSAKARALTTAASRAPALKTRSSSLDSFSRTKSGQSSKVNLHRGEGKKLPSAASSVTFSKPAQAYADTKLAGNPVSSWTGSGVPGASSITGNIRKVEPLMLRHALPSPDHTEVFERYKKLTRSTSEIKPGTVIKPMGSRVDAAYSSDIAKRSPSFEITSNTLHRSLFKGQRQEDQSSSVDPPPKSVDACQEIRKSSPSPDYLRKINEFSSRFPGAVSSSLSAATSFVTSKTDYLKTQAALKLPDYMLPYVCYRDIFKPISEEIEPSNVKTSLSHPQARYSPLSSTMNVSRVPVPRNRAHGMPPKQKRLPCSSPTAGSQTSWEASSLPLQNKFDGPTASSSAGQGLGTYASSSYGAQSPSPKFAPRQVKSTPRPWEDPEKNDPVTQMAMIGARSSLPSRTASSDMDSGSEIYSEAARIRNTAYMTYALTGERARFPGDLVQVVRYESEPSHWTRSETDTAYSQSSFKSEETTPSKKAGTSKKAYIHYLYDNNGHRTQKVVTYKRSDAKKNQLPPGRQITITRSPFEIGHSSYRLSQSSRYGKPDLRKSQIMRKADSKRDGDFQSDQEFSVPPLLQNSTRKKVRNRPSFDHLVPKLASPKGDHFPSQNRANARKRKPQIRMTVPLSHFKSPSKKALKNYFSSRVFKLEPWNLDRPTLPPKRRKRRKKRRKRQKARDEGSDTTISLDLNTAQPQKRKKRPPYGEPAETAVGSLTRRTSPTIFDQRWENFNRSPKHLDQNNKPEMQDDLEFERVYTLGDSRPLIELAEIHRLSPATGKQGRRRRHTRKRKKKKSPQRSSTGFISRARNTSSSPNMRPTTSRTAAPNSLHYNRAINAFFPSRRALQPPIKCQPLSRATTGSIPIAPNQPQRTASSSTVPTEIPSDISCAELREKLSKLENTIKEIQGKLSSVDTPSKDVRKKDDITDEFFYQSDSDSKFIHGKLSSQETPSKDTRKKYNTNESSHPKPSDSEAIPKSSHGKSSGKEVPPKDFRKKRGSASESFNQNPESASTSNHTFKGRRERIRNVPAKVDSSVAVSMKKNKRSNSSPSSVSGSVKTPPCHPMPPSCLRLISPSDTQRSSEGSLIERTARKVKFTLRKKETENNLKTVPRLNLA